MMLITRPYFKAAFLARVALASVLMFVLLAITPIAYQANVLNDNVLREVASLLPGQVAAADREKKKSRKSKKGKKAKQKIDPRMVRKTPAMRNKVYEKLEDAQELSEESKYDEAFVLLKELTERSGRRELNSYEKAQVFTFYAFIYYSKEDYPNAVKYYKEVLKQPEIPISMEIGTLYTLSQLHFVLEDWGNAVGYLEKWFLMAQNPAPDAYILLCQGYIQNKQLGLALVNCLIGVTVAEVKGKTLKENWFVLLRYLYNENDDIPKQLEMLEKLVKNWPKRDYWVGLAAIYGELERQDDQLNALETAYVQGMLKREGELVSLAQLLAASGMPFKAAKVMDKGIKAKQIKDNARNLERLGDYWRRAQETRKALPELQAAANKSEKGEPAVRLAYIYFALTMYKKSAAAAKDGLRKGFVKRPINTKLLLGQSLFYTEDYDSARKLFKEIKKTKEKKHARVRKMATQWASYMEREIVRKREIEKYLN